MTRRITNKSTYEVITKRGRYAVTLERRKNDINGHPRFAANIITLHTFGNDPAAGYFFTASYNFSGHYYSETDEAAFIVSKYEADIEK